MMINEELIGFVDALIAGPRCKDSKTSLKDAGSVALEFPLESTLRVKNKYMIYTLTAGTLT